MPDKSKTPSAEHQSREARGSRPERVTSVGDPSPSVLDMSLHRSAGNRAVSQLLQAPPPPPGEIHRKCSSCSAGNRCEKCQAEEEVIRRKASGLAGPTSSVPPIVPQVLNSPGSPLFEGILGRSIFCGRLGWLDSRCLACTRNASVWCKHWCKR